MVLLGLMQKGANSIDELKRRLSMRKQSKSQSSSGLLLRNKRPNPEEVGKIMEKRQ